MSRKWFRLSRGERMMLLGMGLPALGLVVFLVGYRRGADRAALMQRGEADVIATTLAQKYGPTWKPERVEEWIIRDFFQDQVAQQILDYFARPQYVLVGRYWQSDNVNFWFTPLSAS